MPVQFDPVNKYILITSPTTTISALTIYSDAMDWADELSNMGYPVPMQAKGKLPLGGGAYTDSVFVLVNGWKIKFWSGTYQATITGTLITDDETARTVPPDSGNVEVVFQVSSQGIITTDLTLQNDVVLTRKIETNRWKIDNNQLTIYDNDGTTILKQFNLKDAAGNPAEQNVYERVPV